MAQTGSLQDRVITLFGGSGFIGAHVAQALLDYARGNQVSVIVMGAATHGLKTQRFVATVPIKVAMEAPCTLILVKQALPFEHLGADARTTASAGYSDSDAESGGLSGYGDDLGPLG